jgi:hypothetical protein
MGFLLTEKGVVGGIQYQDFSFSPAKASVLA